MTRQRLKDLGSLGRSKGRREHRAFLVEGVRSLGSALDAGAPLLQVVLADDLHSPLADAARAAGVDVARVPARDLDRIGDARTSQGAVAVSRSVVRAEAPAAGPVVLLDGVQDPGNVGAIVRTAAWFGARAVVADARSADFESPKAVRASMGGLWDLDLARVPDLVPVLDRLAAAGAEVWAADLGGAPVSEWAPDRGSALVLGSEAHGVSPEVSDWLRGQRGGRVFIPSARPAPGDRQPRGAESLNVAVAAGVLLARWLG